MPLIAFVTAYDQFAVKAFEVNAVDYLLKPVEKARLRETLDRAEERIVDAEIVAEQASLEALRLSSQGVRLHQAAGRAIAALAADPKVQARTGMLFGSWEVRRDYRHALVDNTR